MSPQPKFRHGGPVPDDDSDDADGESADTLATLPSVHGRIPIVGGLLAGVGAYGVTYLLAVLLVFVGENGIGYGRDSQESAHAMVKGAWVVLMNLGAVLRVDGEPASTIGGVSRLSFLEFSVSAVSSLIVFGILVVAAYAVADCVETDSVVERIGASLLVVPPYVVFSIGLATLARWEAPGTGDPSDATRELSIAVVDAALYAGLLVPSVLALLGGTLAVCRRLWLANRAPR
ncbi:hypothetical protein [Halovivax cerinus]|uniref:DUF7978 domain-containing protein n=1 Tax=Halovivax cerinus TaxID=1487865 RepID=A0ABD5NKM3_9EURY|nr:hypothetical protein [Halovivax cerinus]